MRYFTKPIEFNTILDLQYVFYTHKLKNNKYVRNKLFKKFKNQPKVLVDICCYVYEKRIESWEPTISTCIEASAGYGVHVIKGKLPDWWHNKMIAASLIKNNFYLSWYFNKLKK